MDAWGKTYYSTMYNLISPNDQKVYSQETFAQIYSDVATQMTLRSLESVISGSTRQGTTAIIQYGVTFNSQMLGEIVDSDRVMRLIETPEGWRIAWSTMDIFDTLAEGTRLELRQTTPPRGNIYDRNGQVLAAQDGQAVLLYIIKNDISDYESCVTALSRVLHLEISDLEARMNQFLPETRFLVGDTDLETYQIEGQALAQLCGVETDAWTTRRYFGELAPHIIGYVSPVRPDQVEEYQSRGYPPDALIGQEGVERSYEQDLAGKIGGKLVIVALTGEILREIGEVPFVPGQDVYLTLDRNLQAAVQQAFVDAYNLAQPTWGKRSPGGAAVVMNVRTGEILAMVSYPGFDPGLFNPDSPVPNRTQVISAIENDPRAPLINRAATGQYPAGSIFKIVSTAAGLDSGIYTPDTKTDCGARWYGQELGDVLPYRTNWNPEDQGVLNFTQALAYSCDPYYWQLGVVLQYQAPGLLAEYAHQMGLGILTGQEDIVENVGLIPDPEYMLRVNQRD
ncbi:MAG: hypothetical protein HY866_00745 [Chloroflexi bacterium]|nr:hypothetical protein [Chloroflexota bacterium]